VACTWLWAALPGHSAFVILPSTFTLGWLWGAYRLAINRLWGGSDVALMSHCGGFGSPSAFFILPSSFTPAWLWAALPGLENVGRTNAIAQRGKTPGFRLLGAFTCRVSHLNLSFPLPLPALCVLASWRLCVNCRSWVHRTVTQSIAKQSQNSARRICVHLRQSRLFAGGKDSSGKR
jgi:hypothetical protein